MVINIKTIKDIQRLEETLLKSDVDEIKEKPIYFHFKLKFNGGRFRNYNPNYIDKFVAQTILTEQTNYEDLLKEIKKQYNVKISHEAKILKFELHKGSLELLTDLVGLTEAFQRMKSIHELFAICFLGGAWIVYTGYTKYLDYKKNELEKKLNAANNKTYSDTINKALETITELSKNIEIQKAINKPKQEIAKMLEDSETFVINDDTQHPITKDKANEFEIIPPKVEDTEEIVENLYNIHTYFFKDKDKSFKLGGIPANAKSITLTPEKRMKIISKAENQQPVKLKLKIIKDGVTKKIKDVYILDYIEK